MVEVRWGTVRASARWLRLIPLLLLVGVLYSGGGVDVARSAERPILPYPRWPARGVLPEVLPTAGAGAVAVVRDDDSTRTPFAEIPFAASQHRIRLPTSPRQVPLVGDRRFGIAATGRTTSASVENALALTGARSWYRYVGVPSTDGPEGQVFLLRTGSHAVSSAHHGTIQSVAAARPGSYWLVGNEPNVGGQDYDTTKDLQANAAEYATTYKRYRDVILAVDPTASFVVGNMLNHTTTCTNCIGIPSGRSFLDAFRSEYIQRFGTPAPVDVWGLHVYVIDWDRPPMTDTVEPLGNIADFRQYVSSIAGESAKPIWITEMGIIWGFQDWCFRIPLTGAITRNCSGGDGQVHPRYPGQPAIVFPFAQAQAELWLTTMLDYFLSNAASLRLDRWFLYTAYGFPDPYTNVYAGVQVLESDAIDAPLTRIGQLFRGRIGR